MNQWNPKRAFEQSKNIEGFFREVCEIFIVIMLSLLKRFYDSSAIYLWKEVNIIFTLF